MSYRTGRKEAQSQLPAARMTGFQLDWSAAIGQKQSFARGMRDY
jgi:hypothetical protein